MHREQIRKKRRTHPLALTSMTQTHHTPVPVLQPLMFFCITVDEKYVGSDAASFYPTFYCYIRTDERGEVQLMGIC